VFEYTSCDQHVFWVAKVGTLFTVFPPAGKKNTASPFQVSLLKDANST